jgi:hypothetical protein
MANTRTPILNALDRAGFNTQFTRGLLRQPATYPEFYEDAILRRTTEPDYGDIPVPKPRPVIPQAVVSTEIAPTRRDLGHVKPFNQPIPVDIATPTPRPTMAERQAAGVLTQPQSQSNRRDNAILATPKRPDMTIGMADALMSIGGAGLRGAQEGGLASLGGMFQQKDAIDEVNRTAALNAYNDQIAQQEAERKARFEQQKQDDLQAYREASLKAKEAKTSTTSAKQEAEDAQRIGQIDETLYDMGRAKDALREGGVTGFFDGFLMKPIDTLFGNKDEVTRMLLSKLRVDDALLRIAQTKGAISNKEMDLFLSPAPNDMKQESVWIAWIEQREDALRNVRRRLSNGVTVENPASEAQIDRFANTPIASGSAPQGEIEIDAETQAILDKYPQ